MPQTRSQTRFRAQPRAHRLRHARDRLHAARISLRAAQAAREESLAIVNFLNDEAVRHMRALQLIRLQAQGQSLRDRTYLDCMERMAGARIEQTLLQFCRWADTDNNRRVDEGELMRRVADIESEVAEMEN